MNKITILFFASVVSITSFAQQSDGNIKLKAQKDSTLRSMMHNDSLKVEKEFAEKERWDKINASAMFPVINAGDYSAAFPVKDPTEIPDPKIDYKLLFELTYNNPDSVAKEINYPLVEITRIINLHVASGIPLNKIMPVIVIHGGALNAFSTNEHYKKRYKTDNPNLKLIDDLEKIGTKIIACGQAMTFLNFTKDDLLPDVKISLTAQTVLSSYQLKGYVWYDMGEAKK